LSGAARTNFVPQKVVHSDSSRRNHGKKIVMAASLSFCLPTKRRAQLKRMNGARTIPKTGKTSKGRTT